MSAETAISTERSVLVAQARWLALFTVSWNVLEGIVAIAAAWVAGSRALLGFGLDSGVESISGAILLWRLNVERREPERAERVEAQALKAIGISFFVLAAFVAFESVRSLINAEHPEPSPVGIALTALSLLVMPILARKKRTVGQAMDSRAVTADSHQTMACVYLSIVVLVGLLLNTLFGWWWADPVAALGVVVFLLQEGRQSFSAERVDDCC